MQLTGKLEEILKILQLPRNSLECSNHFTVQQLAWGDNVSRDQRREEEITLAVPYLIQPCS